MTNVLQKSDSKKFERSEQLSELGTIFDTKRKN